MVGAHEVLGPALYAEGPLGDCRPPMPTPSRYRARLSPGARDGALDIGQAVVMQQGLVLGVEAIEGTDELFRRCAALRRDGPGGVLVKAEARSGAPRRSADDRPDGRSRSRGRVAGDCGGGQATLVLDRDEVIRAADAAGLFVVGIRALMTADGQRAPFIFLVAGEPSGDALGGALIAALRQRTGSGLRVAGIGGERMREQGSRALLRSRISRSSALSRCCRARRLSCAACARRGGGARTCGRTPS